jgi:hypothetical protein
MEIIRSDKGTHKGKISVARTLATMQKLDRWEVSETEVSYGYVRECACRLGRAWNREFSVSHTAEMGDTIVITRTR